MILENLLKMFSDLNCRKIYVKRLSPNDNSKNQVYLAGNFEVLNILPIKEITADDEGDWERTRFKTKLDFYWAENDGTVIQAIDAQLILYPRYPEVRFSGFLKGTKGQHSSLMSSRIDRRLLFFGITDVGSIIGYVASPDSQISNEFEKLRGLEELGIFKAITIEGNVIQLDSRKQLLEQLKRIHDLSWIDSKRLDKNKNILPCTSTNCGGYTLEAEFGISPNGYSEPDYLGWELKQFSVSNFSNFSSQVITLMTPEPTNGYYVEEGIEQFIRRYGYNDKRGREARLNFGGVHKYSRVHPLTKLQLIVEGFDASTGKITNSQGYIAIMDKGEKIAASWSFVTLLKHWNRKHANACYVPSLIRKDATLYTFSKQQYHYSNNIILGCVTDFTFFLKAIVNGDIYYDPGIKLELAISGVRDQKIKRRSQFRINSGKLGSLYKQLEVIDINLIKMS